MLLRCLYTVALLCFVINAGAQNIPDLSVSAPSGTAATISVPPALPGTASPSYSQTFTPKVPISNAVDISVLTDPAKVQLATDYKDGFNRTVQHVERYATTGSSPHLIQPFDTRFSPQPYSFLAYPSDNSFYEPDLFTKQYNYSVSAFSGEQYTAYGTTQNLNDVGQRAVKTLAPGRSQVGQNRGITIKQITNGLNEIKKWTIAANGLPASAGYYAQGMLSGVQQTDAMGGILTTYTDKGGNIVCKIEKQNSTANGTTYNIYDVNGRLRFIMPPKATNAFLASPTLTVNNLCFQFQYDSRGRLSAQQYPGERGFTEVVYDAQDRVVMRRTPNEKNSHQWEITFFDKHGAVKATSLYIDAGGTKQVDWQAWADAGSNTTDTTALAYYLLTVAGQSKYPALTAIANNTILTYTYYDTYSRSDADNSKWNSYTAILQLTPLNMPADAETPIRSNGTYGRVTGSRVRILPGDATTGDWKESAIFYDNKGRVIYTVNYDLYHDTLIHAQYNGLQYDFANRVLYNKQVSYNKNNLDNQLYHSEEGRNSYDGPTGKLVESFRKTEGGPWAPQAIYSYDALGRIGRKVSGNYGEVQDYTFNIRGQMTGINEYYALTGDKQGQSRTFGEVLRYDYGFSQLQYSNKITGTAWRGSDVHKVMAYGYSYDLAGRLLGADYRRLEPPGTVGNLTDSWSNALSDYTVSNLAYDPNGNITGMNQKGVIPGGSIVSIDNLTYTYDSSGISNRLLKVQDNMPDHGLGDFQNPNGTANDYTYDNNGNLNSDANKNITSVTYTHFNKPSVVTFGGGKSISYSYDAIGNKLQEKVHQPDSIDQVTDYIGNEVYRNNKLQFKLTAEGRSTYDSAGNMFKEEYFVEDHLDNVRSIVDVYNYPILDYLATYEVASANVEDQLFDLMDEVRDNKPASPDPNNTKAGNLNGADPSRVVGSSLLMKVMAGDKVEMKVNNYYEGYDPTRDEPLDADHLLSAIVSALDGGNGAITGESHDTKIVDQVFTSDNFNNFEDLVQVNTDDSKPRAFLNYILYDDQMQLVTEGSGSFQANGNGTWTEIGTFVPLTIPTNGYLAVYLSNATRQTNCQLCGSVYFDQLQIRFSRGSLKEETHYYPYGLPMAGMGSAAVGLKENKYKFEGNEFSKSLGLNWMDFHARQYDPQIGRFLGVDPLANKNGQESPFVFTSNDPVRNVDKNGLLTAVIDDAMLAKYGVHLTMKDLRSFKTIVNNAINLIKNNPSVLNAIANTTGFTVSQILDDFQAGRGPTVKLTTNVGGAKGNASGIYMDASIITYLSGIDKDANPEAYNFQLLAIGLTLLHEYGHYGDETTNGKMTGQYVIRKTDKENSHKTDVVFESDFIGSVGYATTGRQKWAISLTGHRGKDVEFAGFGTSFSTNENGSFTETSREDVHWTPYLDKTKITLPEIPTQLPENVRGNNIRKTLGMQ